MIHKETKQEYTLRKFKELSDSEHKLYQELLSLQDENKELQKCLTITRNSRNFNRDLANKLQDENKRLREILGTVLKKHCEPQELEHWLEQAGLNPKDDETPE